MKVLKMLMEISAIILLGIFDFESLGDINYGKPRKFAKKQLLAVKNNLRDVEEIYTKNIMNYIKIISERIQKTEKTLYPDFSTQVASSSYLQRVMYKPHPITKSYAFRNASLFDELNGFASNIDLYSYQAKEGQLRVRVLLSALRNPHIAYQSNELKLIAKELDEKEENEVKIRNELSDHYSDIVENLKKISKEYFIIKRHLQGALVAMILAIEVLEMNSKAAEKFYNGTFYNDWKEDMNDTQIEDPSQKFYYNILKSETLIKIPIKKNVFSPSANTDYKHEEESKGKAEGLGTAEEDALFVFC